ncbi:MAG: preprotein translocase subunit SecG [Pirellulaceae bacterium]
MNLQLPIILADFKEFALGFLLFFVSLFMIFIILIQRGKGGGLAGALTGTAQSAFGAKAGDTMTRVTLVVSLIWILLISVTILAMNKDNANTDDLLKTTGPSSDSFSIEATESEKGESSSNTLGLDPATDSNGEDSTDDNATSSEATEDASADDETSQDSTEDTDSSEAESDDENSTDEASDDE